jgi:hypothetical protein
MTSKSSKILLDRLSYALEREGVTLKRRALLETAAYVFAYRDSNAFTKAAETGSFEAPHVVPIGRLQLPNGEAVIVVTDPIANSAYAIDEAFVEQVVEEERREQIGVTPYGHLVRLDQLAAMTCPDIGSVTAARGADLARLVAQTIEALDGYTAHDTETDLVGQAENALSRASATIDAGAPDGARTHLVSARELLDLVEGRDDSNASLAAANAYLDEALIASLPTGVRGSDPTIEKVLAEALREIDQEIENRKAGGDPNAWTSLVNVSDVGHALLRGWRPKPCASPSDAILVSRDALSLVLDAAGSHIDDVTTGIDDGTYEEADNIGIEDVEQAAEDLRLRLAMPEPKPDADADVRMADGKVDVHYAELKNKHGTDIRMAFDRASLDAEIADYCRENWHEITDHRGVPSDPAGMADQDVITMYYDMMTEHEGNEWCDTSVMSVRMPKAIGPIARTVSSDGGTTECVRCGSVVTDDRCGDETCPFSDVSQSDPQGWAGHPDRDPNPNDDDVRVPGVAPIRRTPEITSADELASVLEEGLSADVWYDAHKHGGSDPQDPDRLAEATIGRVQQAMAEAARILRELKPEPVAGGGYMVDGRIPSRHRIEAQAKAAAGDLPLWITDYDGEDAGQVTITMLAAQKLPYDHSTSEIACLTEAEYDLISEQGVLNAHMDRPVRVGATALWRGRKWVGAYLSFDKDEHQGPTMDEALADARRYVDDHREEIERLGGTISIDEFATEFAHEVNVLLPMELALESPDPRDWNAALGYLLMTNQEKTMRDRVSCEYTAQRVVAGNAYSADPAGDTVWDATFDALRWGTQHAVDILQGDTSHPDDYAHSPLAPKWIRDWSDQHPFEVAPIGLEKALKIAL